MAIVCSSNKGKLLSKETPLLSDSDIQMLGERTIEQGRLGENKYKCTSQKFWYCNKTTKEITFACTQRIIAHLVYSKTHVFSNVLLSFLT